MLLLTGPAGLNGFLVDRTSKENKYQKPNSNSKLIGTVECAGNREKVSTELNAQNFALELAKNSSQEGKDVG